MTIITTLILLLATGIVAVTAVDDCPRQYTSVTSCRDLNPRYFFTFGRNSNTKVTPGMHLLKGFYKNNSVETGYLL